MVGVSKHDSLTVLKLKSLISNERAALAAGEVKAPRKIPCGCGLQLWVMDEVLYWRLPYRFDGKQKTLALGVCNSSKIDLADARERAVAAKALVAEGIDPCQARADEKVARAISQANTFKVIALDWHAKSVASGSWKPAHAEKVLKRLEADLFPVIGKRPIEKIETKDLLHPLNLVIKRGAVDLAKREMQYVGAIMRFAVQTGRLKTNPAVDLRGAIATRKNIHRAALPLNKIPELLGRLDLYGGMLVVKIALKFALLTGARSSEFRFARWSEFDLETGIWTIPQQREAVEGIANSERGEKMNRERLIYLSRQATELIRQLYSLNGRSAFVFQGRKNGAPISENTVNLALAAMGYSTMTDVCLHGFRTMMVSGLNESAYFSVDAIERHIGHEGKDKIRSIYNRNAQYLAERQRMLQWWADYLDANNTHGKYIPPNVFLNDEKVINKSVLPIDIA